ncbi:hypothetical protein KA005_80495 [bacterium]|nr:hypothetical protein [bacterium]
MLIKYQLRNFILKHLYYVRLYTAKRQYERQIKTLQTLHSPFFVIIMPGGLHVAKLANSLVPDEMVWVGGTVSYICLQLAYYMGFSDVYLIGFDHNYTKPDNVITDGTEWTSQGDDPNHFHPGYFGKGKRWHDPRVDRMEMAYKKAQIYFAADGRKICNATVGGCLEVFDRVDYKSLF